MDIQAIALKGQTTEKVEEDMKTIKGVENSCFEEQAKTKRRREETGRGGSSLEAAQ